MANRRVKVNIDLDFTSNRQTLNKIQQDIDKMKQTVELNLDKPAADKLKKEIDVLGHHMQKSLNKSTGKINLKALDTALENNGLSAQSLGKKLNDAGVKGQNSFSQVAKANRYLQDELKGTNSALERMGATLTNTIRWTISSSVVQGVTAEFRKMYYYTKDLDRALTNIRIVSGESAHNMDRFALAANKAAKELRVSTIEYAEAATLFYQQGLRGNDVLNMTEASIIGANITGEAAADMSNLLTAVMNGYKIATEDVLTVTDKLAAVGATTAADFGELATGMSKVASMANAAGVPLDSLNAQLATIVSVTREAPESIGTSLKTIYGRMLMFKNNTDGMMKDEDGELFGAPSVEKALQAYSRATDAQISLFRTTADGTKELRDLGSVIEEIGESWDNTTDKTAKFGLATALAGSRQQNRLVALFDSWDMYKDAMEESLNAEGTSLKQNELYMESYEGRLKGLQAAKEELYMTMMDSDGLKDLISGLTMGVSLVADIAELTGGLYGVIGGIGAALASMGTLKVFDKIGELQEAMVSKSKRSDPQRPLTQEEEDRERLMMIQRTYGKERAEMEREQLVNAQRIHENHKIESDLLQDKATTLSRIEELMTDPNVSAMRAEKEIQSLKQRNIELGISNDEINRMTESYGKLQAADLELKQARANFNQSGTKENQQKLEEASKKVEKLRQDIDRINQEVDGDIIRSGTNVDISESGLKEARSNYEALAKEATRVRNIVTGVQTLSMTLPAIFKTATDETKSFSDVLKTTAAVSVPAVLNGLMRYAPELMAAAKAGTLLKGTLALATGPVGLIAAGVAGLVGLLYLATQHAYKFQKAFDEMQDASSALEEEEGKYQQINEKLKEQKRIKEEIKQVGSPTAEQEEELRNLDSIISRLETQKELQQFVLNAKREELDLAAQEVATTRRDETMPGPYSDSWQVTPDQLTPVEDLAVTTEAYREQNLVIEQLKNQQRELTEEIGSGRQATEEQKSAMAELNTEVAEAEKLASEQKVALSSLIQEVSSYSENLTGATAASRSLQRVAEDQIGTTQNVIKSTDGASVSISEMADEAHDAVTDIEAMIESFSVWDDTIDTTKLNAGELQEFIGQVLETTDLYRDALEELNEEGFLSARTVEALTQAYPDLINVTGLQEEAVRTLLEAMITKNEDGIRAAIEENKTIIENARNNITAYQTEMEAIKQLLAVRAVAGIAMMKMGDLRGGAKKLGEATAFRQKLKDMQGNIKASQAEIEAAEDRIGVLKNSLSAIQASGSGRGGGGRKGGGGRGGGGAKEARVEADIYAEINFLLEKNNQLMSLNKTLQDNPNLDLKERLELMDREYELIQNRQQLLSEYNSMLRAEARGLQSELSGIFDFSGSWDDNSMMIENMHAVQGQSEAVGDKFERIVEIMGELPAASEEWAKLNIELKKLTDSAAKLEKEFIAERVANSKDWIEKRAFYDDWGADNEIDAWERVRAYIQDYYDQGKLSHKEFTDYMLDLDKTLFNKRKELADKELKEYEERRDKWLQTKNEELQDQRDRLSALDSMQEAVVAIIQKRGEAESEALEKAHREEMDSLSKRHNERTKLYQDELDEFNKMIQGKIDALNEQYQEEDYIENLDKEREKATDLQKQIDVLSLDDSLTARNRTTELRKQLADQNEKIAKMQQNRERDLLRKSLEDQKKDKQKDVNDKKDLANELYEKEKAELEKTYEASKELLDKRYANDAVYAEAKESLIRGTVEVTEGAFVDIYDAYVDFENEFGKGMGILGDIIREDFVAELEKAKEAIEDINSLGFAQSVRPDFTEEDYNKVEKSPGKFDEDKYRPETPGKTPNYGVGATKTHADARANEEKLKSRAHVASEIERTERVIRDRLEAGMDVSLQRKYLERLKTGSYDKGGKIVDTGTVISQFHGSQTNPEWIFNDSQLRGILQDVIKSTVKISVPKSPSVASFKKESKPDEYNLNFEIQGNMNEDMLPKVKKLVKEGIKEAQEQKISKYKDIGIRRAIR